MELRDRAPPTCIFCGEPERIEIFEIWDHEMMFETCCEGMHEQIVDDMNDDPAWAQQFLRHLDIETLCGRDLRRVTDDGACGMILDWQLELRPINHGEARAFIDRHHAHCRAPQVWRFHASVWNGRTLLGVAIVGNPVARAFNARGMGRGEPPLRSPGHRDRPALERCLHALRLVRSGGRGSGLEQDHHLHAHR